MGNVSKINKQGGGGGALLDTRKELLNDPTNTNSGKHNVLIFRFYGLGVEVPRPYEMLSTADY